MDLLQQLLFCLCFTPLALLWGGCCCESCEFFSDDFTRADSDDPGDYTEVSGDWDISSNTLVTSSSNAVLLADAQHPAGEANIKVQVTINIASDGDTARIILNYTDSDNYWFGEIKAGTGSYIKIFQRSAGSNTQKATLSAAFPTSTNIALCASIRNSTNLTFTAVPIFRSISATGSFTSDQWGLGTGTATGTRTWTELYASKTNDECPACRANCIYCTNSEGPPLWRHVVTGVANQTCSDCANLEGTFYVPYQDNNCTWANQTVDPISICSGTGVHTHSVSTGGTGPYDLRASVGFSLDTGPSAGTFYGIGFKSTETWDEGEMPCLEISELVLPFDTETGTTTHCDGSSATCEITAIT